MVTPRVHALPGLPWRGDWGGRGDTRPRAVAASGEDDVATREYRHGDDLRRVHWRSTARRGELMVRREEQPWQSRASILLDRRTIAHQGEGAASSLEWAVTAAASVAHHLVRLGYVVRLVDGEVARPWTDPAGEGAGPILDSLAVVQAGGPSSLGEAMRVARQSQTGGLLVAIVGALDVETDDRADPAAPPGNVLRRHRHRLGDVRARNGDEDGRDDGRAGRPARRPGLSADPGRPAGRGSSGVRARAHLPGPAGRGLGRDGSRTRRPGPPGLGAPAHRRARADGEHPMRRDSAAPYLAAMATMLGAACIFPVVDSTAWVGPALLMVVLVTATGLAVRRVTRSGALLLASQLVVGLLGLTAVFASDQAHLLVVPGPGAFQEMGRLVGDGLDATRHFATPAPPLPGIKILIAVGVLLVAVGVDYLAVTRDNAVAAGLPLLALYCVPAAVLPHGASWISFALIAGGWLLLVAHEGRLRVSDWGRTLHPAQGSGAKFREDDLELLGSMARRLSVVTVAAAIVLPAVLPSLPGGLLFPSTGGVSGGGAGNGYSSVDPTLTLRANLTARSTDPVLTYRTNQSNPPPLRLVTDSIFNGSTWRSADGPASSNPKLPSTLPLPDGLVDGVPVTLYSDTISTSRLNETYLPAPAPPRSVSVKGSWSYAPDTLDILSRGHGTAGLTYTVGYFDVEPTASQLEAAAPAPSAITDQYLQLPAHLDPLIAKIARQVTAKSTNDYERAVALQDYFRDTGGFTYSTAVTDTPGDAVAGFLLTKRGYCVQFSSAMAVMARVLGIPARIDVGFLPGTLEKNGSYSVSLNDAHAWPELYFGGIGWVRFEPTPAVRTGNAPGYTIPAAQSAGAAGATGGVAGTAGGDSSSDAQNGRRLSDLSGAISAAPVTAPAVVATPSRFPVKVIVAAVVALILLLVTPLLAWFARVRRRRRATDAVARSEAAWADLLERVGDLGFELPAGSTPRQSERLLTEVAGLGEEPRAALSRLVRVVESARYAPAPAPVDGVGPDVETVVRAVRSATGRRRRLRARVLPRSGTERLRGLSAQASEGLSVLDIRLASTRRSVTRRPERRRSGR